MFSAMSKPADVWFTGEMPHVRFSLFIVRDNTYGCAQHEVLAAVAAGTHVVLRKLSRILEKYILTPIRRRAHEHGARVPPYARDETESGAQRSSRRFYHQQGRCAPLGVCVNLGIVLTNLAFQIASAVEPFFSCSRSTETPRDSRIYSHSSPPAQCPITGWALIWALMANLASVNLSTASSRLSGQQASPPNARLSLTTLRPPGTMQWLKKRCAETRSVIATLIAVCTAEAYFCQSLLALTKLNPDDARHALDAIGQARAGFPATWL